MALVALCQLSALAQSEYWTEACEANLKLFGAALKIYANDHHGEYPKGLKSLLSKHSKLGKSYLDIAAERLKQQPKTSLPVCPRGGQYALVLVRDPAGFRLFCKGKHHPELGRDLPAYSSATGLETKSPQESR